MTRDLEHSRRRRRRRRCLGGKNVPLLKCYVLHDQNV